MSDDCRSDLRELGTWGVIAFAAGCAYRLARVIVHFGAPETKIVFDTVVNELWKQAGLDKHTRCRASGALMSQIETTNEASVDDPHRRAYYSMRGLGVLADAITAAGADSDDAAAQAACAAADGACSLAADIAFEVSQGTGGKPGIREDLELDYQLRLRKMISGGSSLEEIKAFCASEAWPDEPLRQLDMLRGWLPTKA
jgi:hypothetical protein